MSLVENHIILHMQQAYMYTVNSRQSLDKVGDSSSS